MRIAKKFSSLLFSFMIAMSIITSPIFSIDILALESTGNSTNGLKLSSAHFPDSNFRQYISNFDTDKDGYLSDSEIRKITDINVCDSNIQDLSGIEYLTSVKEIDCQLNSLSSLDVSKNTALINLMCGSNQLTTLDVSKNTALTNLQCSWNKLTTLDVSKNTALIDLRCENNQLTSLDVSKNTALTYLNCSRNQLTTLDVSKNTALISLSCSDNQLTTLDVSKNAALISLSCSGNQLTTLDVRKNISLTQLICSNNQLTSLDVSKNTSLLELYCAYNKLTKLDVSNNTSLWELYCINNQLKELDVSKNTALTYLSCSNNQLTELDVSKNTALIDLRCENNQLTSLDVSKNTALRDLNCSNNYLSNFPQGLSDSTHCTYAVLSQPKEYRGPVGSTVSFSVTAAGTGLTYQWQVISDRGWINSNASGSKTSKISFNVTSSHHSKKYRCVITDSYGKKVYSDIATIIVTPPLTITKQPVNYTGAAGNTATFSVTAQGTDPTYQWQVYSNGTWANSGATGAKTSKISFNITNNHNGKKYRCVIKDKNGQTVISNAVTVNVVSSLTITKQPANYAGALGSTASFSVTAQGSGLSYQWQVYSNGTWSNSGATGAKTSKISFKVTKSHNGMKYRCVIKDKNGKTVTSNAASVKIVTALTITKQPTNYTGIAGDMATFTVTASGEGLTYQWQVYSNGAWRNSGATGATTNKIAFKVTKSHNGMKYRCVIKDKYGKTVTTNAVTMTVK